MTSAGRETADVETASAGYAARFSGPVGAWMLGVQEAIVLGWLEREVQADILDVGGGHGQLAAPRARRGHRVTVAGSSAEAADGIRREVVDGLIRFARADLPLLPFPDRAFDAVVCVRLLAHCARWRELVAELCRTARNAVIVDYPARRSVNALAFALFGLKKRVEGNTRPYALFRDGQVRREFARCGFAVGARRPQFFFPLVLHRALRARRLSAAMETAAARVFLTAAFGSPVLVRAAREGGEK